MVPTLPRTARRRALPSRSAAAPTRRPDLLRRLGSVALVLAFAGTAQAVRQPDDLIERPLETAGTPARAIERTTWIAPPAADKRWAASRFAGGSWTALWDADTGVPQRIYGEGIAAPGAMADAVVAERAARELLAAELPLLAPGAKLSDFVLMLDQVHMKGARRTVAFAQHRDGLRVVDARVGFLFAHDRLVMIASTAAPDLTVSAPGTTITDAKARDAAKAWIARAYPAGTPVVTDVGAPVILPIVGDRRGLDARAVVPVTVAMASPRALWTVYVDAATAEPVARHQRLMFASGTMQYRVPERYPDGDYADYPAPFMTQEVNDTLTTSAQNGTFSWSGGASAQVEPTTTGTFVDVTTTVQPVDATFTIAPSGTVIWDLSAVEKQDAQLSAYIHTNLVKQFAKDHFDDELDWLFDVIPVAVNEEGTCNAFSNGDDIHFFPEADGCANTARLADVVYHEFGHSLHGQSLLDGRFDSAFSEGISDVLAALITDDPAMGLGFFLTDAPLRHIDPENYEYRWPEDADLDPHETGLIIASAMWDLRNALVDELGLAAGKALTEDLYYEMIRRSDGIPSAFAEVMAADDDDGDLANGTPHGCLIQHVFAAHGLTADDGGSFGIVSPPSSDGRLLVLTAPPDTSACPVSIANASVTWRLRETPTTIGNVAFDVAGGSATAAIPPQLDGEVIQYQIHATLDDGTVWTLPRNYADEWYELYVGPVTKLYCASMDVDPSLEDGWQLTGDFMYAPAEPGVNRNDPELAFTGTGVVGTKIGGRGSYSEARTSDAFLPELDVSGYSNVRLQYWRWLTVEDGNRDRAAILADGAPLWENARSPTGQLDHRDIEWRFQDVDLTALSGNGKVKVQFQLTSDSDRQLGGWTLDDVCVVAAGRPLCGDERVSTDEQCDDGNTDDGDGCSAGCHLEGGPPVTDEPGCCSTGSGAAPGTLLLGLLTLGGALHRRRRR